MPEVKTEVKVDSKTITPSVEDYIRYVGEVLGASYLPVRSSSSSSANVITTTAISPVVFVGQSDCFEGENRNLIERLRVALDWPSDQVELRIVPNHLGDRGIDKEALWQSKPIHFALVFGLGSAALPKDSSFRAILVDHPSLMRADPEVKRKVWNQIKDFHRKFFFE